MNDLHQYCLDLARRAKTAAAELAQATGAQKQQWLRDSARLLAERPAALIEANRLDLAAAPGFGLTDAQIDRLTADPAAHRGHAQALEEVAALPEPIGEMISSSIRPNGLEVQKVRVPLGVIFFIYESRPNVTTDAAAHLRQERQRGDPPRRQGGRPLQCGDRGRSWPRRPPRAGLPADAVQLVATPDRAAVGELLHMPEYIDLAIPRGGEGPDPPRDRGGADAGA